MSSIVIIRMTTPPSTIMLIGFYTCFTLYAENQCILFSILLSLLGLTLCIPLKKNSAQHRYQQHRHAVNVFLLKPCRPRPNNVGNFFKAVGFIMTPNDKE